MFPVSLQLQPDSSSVDVVMTPPPAATPPRPAMPGQWVDTPELTPAPTSVAAPEHIAGPARLLTDPFPFPTGLRRASARGTAVSRVRAVAALLESESLPVARPHGSRIPSSGQLGNASSADILDTDMSDNVVFDTNLVDADVIDTGLPDAQAADTYVVATNTTRTDVHDADLDADLADAEALDTSLVVTDAPANVVNTNAPDTNLADTNATNNNVVTDTETPAMPVPRNKSKTKRLRAYYAGLRLVRKSSPVSRHETNEVNTDATDTHLNHSTSPQTPTDTRHDPVLGSILRNQQRRAFRESTRFTSGTVRPEPEDHTPSTSPSVDPSSPPIVVPYHGPRPSNELLDGKTWRQRIDNIFAEPSLLDLSFASRNLIQAENERKAHQEAEAARKAEEAAIAAVEAERKAAEERAQRELAAQLERTHGLRKPEKPIVEQLSEEWLQRTHDTLRAAASTALATTAEGIELRRHDFAKVVPATEWLNDEVINGSLNWLDRGVNSLAGIKDFRRQGRHCLSLSSFFWKQLNERGVRNTQRTLRRCGVDIDNFLDVRTILIPVCERNHWTLMVVRPSSRTIAHMDSLNPRGSTVNTNLALAWVTEFLGDKFIASEWSVVRHEAPAQTNGWDCGVHTITNAFCVALGLNAIDCYTAEDMPLQRLRITSVLLNQGFHGDFDLRAY